MRCSDLSGALILVCQIVTVRTRYPGLLSASEKESGHRRFAPKMLIAPGLVVKS